jgi:hypothetical protein
MRERHLPRLCRSCHGPMARQDDACWRCGAPRAAEELADTILPPHAVLKITDGSIALAATASGLDADRWASEGGTLPGPDRAVATARSGGRR